MKFSSQEDLILIAYLRTYQKKINFISLYTYYSYFVSYDLISDTVKAYLEKNKLGKYNKEEVEKKEQQRKKEEEEEERLAQNIKLNDRCLVKVLGQPQRRGQVMFVGKCFSFVS